MKRSEYGDVIITLYPSTGSLIIIPVHTGKTLAPKTLQSILQAAGITQEEFEKKL